MPIYEFQCNDCKNVFEMLTLGMREKADAVCPKCKSRKTSRMMSSFSKGRYSSLGGGTLGSSGSGGSSCSSCSSTNCSSCGH